MRLACPKCKVAIEADPADAGMVVECPQCAAQVRVPAPTPRQPNIVVKTENQPEPPPPPPPSPEDQPKKEGVGSRISYPALAMWIAAAALIVGSGLILYTSIRKWAFKSNYEDALHLHDSNQPANVGKACESALKWNSGHHPTRELWAKVLADAGALESAEAKYQELIKLGQRKPSIYASLGAVYLKMADRDPEHVVELVGKAQDAYAQAQGIPEAAIGAGLCALMLGVKKNDPSKIKEAKTKLEAAMTGVNDKVSRDGLMDLYMGLSAAAAMTGDDKAVEYSDMANQFAAGWNVPLSNQLLVRARRMADHPMPAEEFKRRANELKDGLKELHDRTANKKLFGDVSAAVDEFTVANIMEFLRNGEHELAINYMMSVNHDGKYTFETLVSLNEGWRRAFEPWDGKPYSYITRSAIGLTQGLIGSADAAKDLPLRSIAHNNLAAYKEYVIVLNKAETQNYRAELEELRLALVDNPNNYAAARNRAVLLKRNAWATKAPDQKKGFADQCQEALKLAEEIAAKSGEAWMAADLAKVKAYCEKP